MAQATEAKRAYQADWRARNKDRIRAVRLAWNADNPDKVAEYRRSEKFSAKKARWQKKFWDQASPEVRKKRSLRTARQNAKARGLEFKVTVSDLVWPLYCPVLGIKLNYGKPTRPRASPDSPSLDRTDSSKGYVPGNVAVMSWRANEIKGNATLEELEKLVEYLRSMKGR